MESNRIPSAIVSTDPGLREMLRAALDASAQRIAVRAQIGLPYGEIGAEELQRLREADPALIFLDLEDDPATGIRFAQFLADAAPGRCFVAAGPPLSAELLMEAMRAGISEYLPKPVTQAALDEALERVARKLGGGGNGAGGAREPGEILSIVSAKGGSGSTTVATNLAILLHRLTGKRTLLLDLDLELGETAVFLGMQPRFNFVDLVRNFHRMDAELLASYIERHDSGVHLLSAPFQPDKAEPVGGDQIRKVLVFLRQHYDYVVVDTPKGFSPATVAAFEQAAQIFIVATADLPSLRNIKRLAPLLARIAGASRDKVHLVVNRYRANDLISLDEVRQALGMEVFWTLANDYDAVIRAINAGQPVVQNTGSVFVRDLQALAAEVGGLGALRNGRRSPFGRLKQLFARKLPEEAVAHD